ncbi:MAG: hypothetical protein WC749_01980 [Dehalococcoidia bacterium]
MANDKPFESFSAVMESLIMSDNSARAKILLSILSERDRQTSVEGYTPAHDDEHTEGQLALLAAAYALSSREGGPSVKEQLDPSSECWLPSKASEEILLLLEPYSWSFKPTIPIHDLTRAGALILAELERLLRMEDPHV